MTSQKRRNNSLIPVEYRNDKSDGGIERAALATVFGVKEYTEPKKFWNSSAKSSILPAHTKLPFIPVVSQFNDLWSETCFTSIHPPLDLSDYNQFNLFDLIESDDNPNIILWSIPHSNKSTTGNNKKKAKKSRWLLGDFKKKKTPTTTIQETQQENPAIEAATTEKLIEKLTITLDYTFMTDFFLIYRVFMSPLQLCKFLILRFKWSLEKNEEKRSIVRIRTFVVMRHWLLNYFYHDFIPNKELRKTLTNFLNEMPLHPVIKQSVRDQRIIKGLKQVARRLKKIHYAPMDEKKTTNFIQPTKDSNLIRNSLSATTINQQTAFADSRKTNMSNNSLASTITPGNSDIEEDISLKSSTSFRSIADVNVLNISDMLTERLERIYQLPEDCIRPRSFYSAQLAIPSEIPTPEIIYPTIYDNNALSSTSFNSSMAYPSDSEVVTPPNNVPIFNSNNYFQPTSKRSTLIDPKIKPLPALLNKDKNQMGESWKLSANKNVMEIDLCPNQTEILSSLFTPSSQESSIILNYPTFLIVQQFCLIEKSILLEISWEELIDCNWIKNANNSIEKVIDRFNSVCQWVTSEIVQTKQLNQRVKVIEKFIRIAKKCKLYSNFTTLMQILLGLQSPSVSRLTKTWSRVDKRILNTLHELSAFTSPTKNWKHIRDMMTQVAEESPTEQSKLPFGGCIPFLGLYLSDLIFNAELPSYLPSTNINVQKIHQGMVDIVLSQPLVHFRKHRVMATIIKRILVFQNLAKKYPFIKTDDALLYSTCLNAISLDKDTIQNLSFEIEP